MRQVELLDRNLTTVSDICKIYDVSEAAVRKWRKRFSPHYRHRTRIVVEMESEEKKNLALQKRVAELEAAVGRKQMEIDYLNKLLEVSSSTLGVDVRKKGELPRSNGSGTIENPTVGK